jgi:cytochrome P450
MEPLHLDLAGPDYEARPYELIEEARARAWYATSDHGTVVLNQDEGAHLMRHPDFAFAMPQLDPAENAYLASRVPEVLLAKHGADHRRMRALVSKAMRERVVESLRADVRAIVDRLVDELPESGEVDLVHAFTRLLPRRILGPMLGVPYEAVDGIDEWIRISARAIDPVARKDELPAIAEAWKALGTISPASSRSAAPTPAPTSIPS